MELKVFFNPYNGLVTMEFSPFGTIFMPRDVFRKYHEGNKQTIKRIDDWELRHSDTEIDEGSAIAEFERMLNAGYS